MILSESWYYFYQDDYDTAYDLAIKAIDLFEQHDYDIHPYDYALHQAAYYAYYAGKFELGIQWAEKCLSRRLAMGGQKHPYYLTTLNLLAALYDEHEDYRLAIKTYDEELAIYKSSKLFGTADHSCVLNSACEAYTTIGNFQKGLELARQAMLIDKQLQLLDEDNFLDISYNNIAFCFDNLNQKDSAYFYCKQSIEIEKKRTGSLRTSAIPNLLNNAQYAIELRLYDEAKYYINLAEKLSKKIKSSQNTTSALVDMIKGHYYKAVNDIKNAVFFYEDAKKAISSSRGIENEDYAICCTSLMDCAYITSNEELLVTNASEYLNYIRAKMIKMFLSMSPNQRDKFWAKHELVLENSFPLFSLKFNSKPINEMVYDAQLISKGILLSTDQSIRQIAQSSGDSITIDIANKIDNLSDEYNELLYKKENVGNSKTLDKISLELDELYEKLIQRSNIYSEVLSNYKTKWQDVKSSLQDDAIAIEFCKVKDELDIKYVAILLTSSSVFPQVISLCSEKELSNIQDPYKGQTLYNLIWKKILVNIEGVKKIYFAASGIIHSIAIENCVIKDNVRLTEKYDIYRLSSTREIPRKKTSISKHNSVIYGGLQYEADEEDIFEVNQFYPKKKKNEFYSYADRGAMSKGVKYLPGTMREISLIEDEIKKKHGSVTSLFKGLKGTEESFYSLVKDSINILHFSTHGFCSLKDEETSTTYVDGNITSFREKALNCTGLVLSGANHYLKGFEPFEEMEDGILTSKEIASQYFPNLNLVVLSACETGIGLITPDGVFGLQRGFKKAGANGLIMTLWKVDDEATMYLMDSFYKEMLSGKSAHDSLLSAQNIVKNTTGFEAPEYWAGFILLDGLN